MKRGEVWWAELLGDAGFRPVVIVSRASGLDQRTSLTVAEITRVARKLPSEVSLSAAEGMPVACVVNTDNLHTIPRTSLRERMITLRPERLFALSNALRHSLDLED